MALEEREIQVLISYATDPQSRQAIQSAFDSLEGGFKNAKEAAASLDAEYSKILEKIGLMSDPQKRAAATEAIGNLRQMGRANLDTAEAAGTLNGEFVIQRENLRKTASGFDQVDQSAKTSTVSIRNFGGAMRWAMLGLGMQQVGRALTSASGKVFGLAGEYAKGAGENDAVAKRWLGSMERIEQSQMRIGRLLATQINPQLEKLADIVEEAADFADKHPEAVKAIAQLAVGGAITGKLLTSIGVPIAMIGTMLRMTGAASALTGAGTGAAAAGGAAAVGGLSIGAMVPIVGAVILAVVATGIIGKILSAERIRGDVDAARKELELLKRYQAGETLTPKERGEMRQNLPGSFGMAKAGVDVLVANRIKFLEETLSSLGDTAADTGGDVSTLEGAVQSFIQYRKTETEEAAKYNAERNQIEEKAAEERVQIEQNAEAERNQIIADGAAQRAKELEEFNFSQARQARDWAKSESQWEEDYYAQRTETVKGDHEEIIRAEQDFQIHMRQLRADHEERLEDLVANRDALGIVREMRSYERQRREATEEHNLEMKRMKADNADKLQEMDIQFAREKNRRIEDNEQKLADQQEDFNRQMEQEKAAENKRLAAIDAQKQEELQKLKEKTRDELRALDQQYQAEKDRRYNAYVQQLNDLDVFHGKIKTAWDAFYAQSEADFKAWIARVESSTSGLGTGAPSKQHGGYVGSGLYRLHGGEYVLNPATTRQAERFVGGGLTQGRLIGALAGGGGVVIENLTLPGTNMNEQQLSRFLRDKFPGYMADAIAKARGRLNI